MTAALRHINRLDVEIPNANVVSRFLREAGYGEFLDDDVFAVHSTRTLLGMVGDPYARMMTEDGPTQVVVTRVDSRISTAQQWEHLVRVLRSQFYDNYVFLRGSRYPDSTARIRTVRSVPAVYISAA